MNCANHPDRERISFCQNCGKPLCVECSRTVGSGVFCEPCLAARLAAANAAQSGGQPVAGIPIPPVDSGPNPVLAAVLGFIPGVGAMYNGQYAKGVVHLIVFAVLVSLADSNGIFGIFVAGWEFYMAFEAYHTARARRDGTPLPNPFGLNDIGERLGFSKTWMPPVGSPVSANASAPPAPGAPPPPAQYARDAGGNVIYSAVDGTVFTRSASGAQAYSVPADPPPPAGAWGPASYSQAYTYGPPQATPFTPLAPDPAPLPLVQNRFPTGAIWLIGLGLLFFFGSTGILRGYPIHRLIPFFLIGLGVWLFVRKMTAFGHPLDDDGTPEYRQRVVVALRGSIWVILVGVLFLLDSFNVLSWGRSWPLFIIVAGVMTLLQRYAYHAPPAAMPYPPNPVPASPEIPTNQEGR